jgi:phosphatidylinositol alpha 1,6-mannosyltransferase
LARYYGDADVFVFPSRTDTFGAVVPEAQAAGVPVVAVGALGSTATVEDGVSGLHAAHDAIDLARHVARILSEPTLAGTLRTGGRRRALDFSAHAITARYVRAYTELLGRGELAASER